jgi:hypothetical protein
MAKQDVSPSIDLFGVDVRLWIESNGKMVPFRSLAGNATDYVENISVKIGLMETFQLEVKICPPLADAVRLINTGKIGLGFSLSSSDSTTKTTNSGDGVQGSSSKFSLNKMAVQIRYGGRVSPVFKALLLMPEVEVGEEGIDITMKGIGMLFESTKTPAILPGTMTPMDAIKKWMGDGVNVHVKFDDRAAKELSQNTSTFPVTKSGFEATKHVLEQHNCRMYYAGASTVDGLQTVQVVHDEFRRQKSAIKFVAFKQINPNKNIYPILNLSAPINNLVLSAAIHGSKTALVDKANKNVTQQDGGAASYAKKNTTKITTQDGSAPGGADSGNRNEYAEPAGVGDGSTIGTMMGAISRPFNDGVDAIHGVVHSWMNQVFNYDISSVMIADLLPGRMVGVNVADIAALTGDYDLKTVEHSVGSGGAETKIEIVAMGGLVSAVGKGLNKAVGLAVSTEQKATKTSSTAGVVTQ